MSDIGGTHTVARAISACARCRSRKSKCDGKLPACGSCVKAKVECIGFDAVSKKNVSRSYLYELEQEIVQLRRELASRDAVSASHNGQGQSGNGNNGENSNGVGAHHHPLSPSEHHSRPYNDDRGSAQQSMNGPNDASSSYNGFHSGQQETKPDIAMFNQPYSDHTNQQQQQGYSGQIMIDPQLQSSSSPYQPMNQSYFRAQSHPASTPNGTPGDASSSTSGRKDIGSLVNGVGFAGVESGEPKFMGTSSGISLARMVLSSVMKTGPAGATHPNYNPSSQINHYGSSSNTPNHAEAEALDALAQLAQHPEYTSTQSTTGSNAVPTSNLRGGDPSSSSSSYAISPSVGGAQGTSPAEGGANESGSVPPKRERIHIPALPPRGAIERLLEVYDQYIQFQNQTLHMPSFIRQLTRVLDEPDEASEVDLFFVLMFLALSTMALSRTMDPTSDLRMSSEAFHAEAMKHIDCILASSNYIGIQGILLCCQYALFNPGRGSIWYLTGMAMRQCIEYGYHHESPSSSDNNPLEIDMKRRLFWQAYKLDRQLCFNLGRPPMISDEFINTPYPSLMDDSLISETSLGTGEPAVCKQVSRHVITIRRIQSDIQRRLHRVNPGDKVCLMGMPDEEWFANMLEQLKTWLNNVPVGDLSLQVGAEQWAVMFHNSVLLLFRPSPACPRPTRAALSACLRSSSYLIRIVRRMYQANKMNYLWLGAHTLFMAGITYLYSLWNVAIGNIDDPPSLEESISDIQSCTSVLQALSFNVSSSAACRETFEILSTAVLRRLTDGDTGNYLDVSLMPASTLGAVDSANSGLNDLNAFMGSGRPSSTCGPHIDDPAGDSGRAVEQAAPPLPSDLQGLDDLFLKPLGSHMSSFESTRDPFGSQATGDHSFDQQSVFDNIINSPAPTANFSAQ